MKALKVLLLLLTILCTTSACKNTDERNERIRERWNRSLVNDSNYVFNKEANNLLSLTIESVQAGKALCVGMGQGRNALYLARNGWDVTGFDLADEAVAYAIKQAKAENVKLTTKIASFETFDYGTNKWDLITWIYGGCLEIEGITKKIKTALKPGGLFVFEFFHREAGIKMNRRPFGCEENSIRDMFIEEGGFEILLYEEKEGVADYGMATEKLVYMVITKL